MSQGLVDARLTEDEAGIFAQQADQGFAVHMGIAGTTGDRFTLGDVEPLCQFTLYAANQYAAFEDAGQGVVALVGVSVFVFFHRWLHVPGRYRGRCPL